MTLTTKKEAFQLAFTTVVRGLASQGWQQCRASYVSPDAHPSVGCRWTVGDRHCAVGWLLEPKAPDGASGGAKNALKHGLLPELMKWAGPEGSINYIALTSFMEEMLSTHDYHSDPEFMHSAFIGLSRRHGLDWSAGAP